MDGPRPSPRAGKCGHDVRLLRGPREFARRLQGMRDLRGVGNRCCPSPSEHSEQVRVQASPRAGPHPGSSPGQAPLPAPVECAAGIGEARGEGEAARRLHGVTLVLLAVLLSNVAHGGERCWRWLRTRWRGCGGAFAFTLAALIPVPFAPCHKCALPRLTGRVPNVGVRLSLRTGGRSLDNRPAGHTDRGAPVGIRSAAVGRLRPSLSARFKGSQTPHLLLAKASGGDAAGFEVLGVGNGQSGVGKDRRARPA